MPADDSYDCEWEIKLIDTLWNTPDIYDKIKQKWQDENVIAFTDVTLKTIYIEKHTTQFYQPLGCTTLWHEIRHAWGDMEEELTLCQYTYRDHIDKYNRLNFYPNQNLPLP